MNDAQTLRAIRILHAAIYVVLMICTCILLYAGITGAYSLWLWIALALLAVEVCVYVGFGMRCPVTDWAVKYGAPQGHAFDTHLSKRHSDWLFNTITALMALGLLLLA
ncbi:MAG TPA: hypothetical protein VGN70_05985, partial [Gammaproteobacteria bacterium]